jgi:hypothetical protein
MSRVQTFDTSMIKKKKENMMAGTIICTAIRSALASDNKQCRPSDRTEAIQTSSNFSDTRNTVKHRMATEQAHL